MKKRLCVAAIGAAALLGLGSGLAPASANAPVARKSVTTAAPACTEVYMLFRLGYCWYGLN
jgi:hypothetical protein